MRFVQSKQTLEAALAVRTARRPDADQNAALFQRVQQHFSAHTAERYGQNMRRRALRIGDYLHIGHPVFQSFLQVF